MTLIELLVSIMVIGLIATVLSAAITVVLRQAPETTARADTARWEQNLGTWLPADLTSAEWPTDADGDGIPDDPTEGITYAAYQPAPCGISDCTWGENVAHLSWNENGVGVDVSYRYGQSDDGTYEFRRVECRAGSCSSITLVRNMPEPSSGGEPPISVTFPPDVLSTDPNGSPILNTSGRRVSVSVTGLNGIDLLSYSGGGTERIDLEPAAIQPPEFLQARSGCGGPVTLIVDTSGSIGSAYTDVRAGVRSFVSTFAGTPTQLQLIEFNSTADVLGPSANGWNHWFDLSEPGVVNSLTGSGSPIDTLGSNGATNWEDAFYRVFYTETGQTYQALANPANPPSELVVFFTDGLPTQDRDTDSRTGAASPGVAPSDVPNHFDYDNLTGSGVVQFSPRGWYRASELLKLQTTRLIGVGVGPAFDDVVNLDRDTNIPDPIIASDWSAEEYDDPGQNFSDARRIPAEVALGDLIAGNDVSNYVDDASGRYVKVSYNGGWDPEAVRNADLLTTPDFAQFGGALESIALAECGGTLTVQTRKVSDGAPLPASVTYEVTGVDRPLTESSTSAVAKTAAFDISAEGGTSAEVLLKPRSLEGTGFRADSWTCRSKNVEINDPSKMSLADGSAGPSGGIDIRVDANEAVSCILWVVPS